MGSLGKAKLWLTTVAGLWIPVDSVCFIAIQVSDSVHFLSILIVTNRSTL